MVTSLLILNIILIALYFKEGLFTKFGFLSVVLPPVVLASSIFLISSTMLASTPFELVQYTMSILSLFAGGLLFVLTIGNFLLAKTESDS